MMMKSPRTALAAAATALTTIASAATAATVSYDTTVVFPTNDGLFTTGELVNVELNFGGLNGESVISTFTDLQGNQSSLSLSAAATVFNGNSVILLSYDPSFQSGGAILDDLNQTATASDSIFDILQKALPNASLTPLIIGQDGIGVAGSYQGVLNSDINIAPVNLPASGLLLLGAVAGIAAMRRRNGTALNPA